MTPEERNILQHLGECILIDFCNASLVTLFGVFIVIFCDATCSTMRGLRGPARLFLFAISTITFLAASAHCLISVGTVYLGVRVLVDNPGMLLAENVTSAKHRIGQLSAPRAWIWRILPFMVDTVTIWRGAVLFPDRRWGSIVSSFLCLTGLVIMLVKQVIIIRYHQPETDPAFCFGTADAIGVTFSLAANVVSTGVIASGVWSYRRFVFTQLDGRRTPVLKILHLFLESGVIYCILQALIVSFQFLQPRKFDVTHFVSDLFSNAYIMISAIYPSLVALVIKHQDTFVETYTQNSTLCTGQTV